VFDVLARQLSRGLSRPLSSDLDGITRIVFIDLDDTASAHYLLGTPFVALADFSLPVYFVTSSSTTQIIFGDSLSADSFIAILSTGVIRTKIAGVSIDSTAVFADGEEHYLVPSRDGSAVTVYVDGVLVANGTASGTVTLDSAGRNINNAPFDGILSRPSFIDLTTPANSLYFKLNQLAKEYELPTNNVFGSEEITNNTFINTTGWAPARAQSVLSVVSNKLRATISSTSTFGSSFLMNSLVIGETYRVTASAVSNNAGATVRLRIATDTGLGSTIVNVDASGSVAIDTVFIATATSMYVGTIVTGQDSGDYVDIEAGISIKSVTNYITYQNIATGTATRNTYELLNSDTQWVSPTRTINIAAQA
jgi:hypothetical protein